MLQNLYRAPDRAYAAMDFTGIGAIHESDFMNSLAIKRSNLPIEELKDFFYLSNMFGTNGMNFDSFKKTFFPHLYLIQDENEMEIE